MRGMRRLSAVSLILLLLMVTPAFAWNKPGHMVTGAIACDALTKDDPALLASLVKILRDSGLFTSKIANVPPDQQAKVLMMFAARWPDDIRTNQAYSHPKWHYIDIPFVPPGDDMKPPQEVAKENAVTELKANIEKFKAADTSPRDRAIALCWILHLTGDLHQPLHATSMYSKTYPDGDRGGNSQYIRAEANGRVLNLHSVWDGLILGSESITDARNMATTLEQRPDLAKNKLPGLNDLDPADWAKESFNLAVKVAYLDGKLKSSNDRHSGPVLPDSYLKNAKATAERQIVTAGYRLAAELEQIRPVSSTPAAK